jgi:hypothetical protein
MKKISILILGFVINFIATAQTNPRNSTQSLPSETRNNSASPMLGNLLPNASLPSSTTNFTAGKLYKFVNINSKLYLGSADFSQIEGNDFRQYADGGQSNIQWLIDKQPQNNFIIKSADESTCMAIDGEAPNQIVTLVSFNSANGQKWVFESQINGDIKIKNVLTNKYIGVEEGSFVEGAKVKLCDNTVENLLLWRAVEVVPERNYKSISAGAYNIKNINSGLYIAPTETDIAEGIDCKQQKLNTQTKECLFDLEVQQDGTYFIVQKNSGLCLELDNLSNPPVFVKSINSPTIKWRISETESKNYIIKSVFTGQILCIRDGVKNEGGAISKTAKTNEKMNYAQWTFEKDDAAVIVGNGGNGSNGNNNINLNGNYYIASFFCSNSFLSSLRNGSISLDTAKLNFLLNIINGKGDIKVGRGVFNYDIIAGDSTIIKIKIGNSGKINSEWNFIPSIDGSYLIQCAKRTSLYLSMYRDNPAKLMTLQNEANATFGQHFILINADSLNNIITEPININDETNTGTVDVKNLKQKIINGHYIISSSKSGSYLCSKKNTIGKSIILSPIKNNEINAVVGISTDDNKSTFGPLEGYYNYIVTNDSNPRIVLEQQDYYWKFLEVKDNNLMIESIVNPGFFLTEVLSTGTLKFMQYQVSNDYCQIWHCKSLATVLANTDEPNAYDSSDNELYEVSFTPYGVYPIWGYEQTNDDPIDLKGTLSVKLYDGIVDEFGNKGLTKEKNNKTNIIFNVDDVEIRKTVNKINYKESNVNMGRSYIIKKKKINNNAYLNIKTDFRDIDGPIGLFIPFSMAPRQGIGATINGRDIKILDILNAENKILIFTEELEAGDEKMFLTYKLTIKKM